MSWIALFLVGIAVADLADSVRRTPVVCEGVGAAVAVFLGLIAGLTGVRDLLALVVIAALVVAWGQTVRHGLERSMAWLPLTILGAALLLGVLVSGYAGRADGPLAQWLGQVGLPGLRRLGADRALLLLGVALAQLSTGNVVVRLVLAATHTSGAPRTLGDEGEDVEISLKGGRLLGPMERLVILGLGLGGQWTAASIVVAAKGLLRWPELSSTRGQVEIHKLTEYFLVGSFVSWLVALAGLVLLAR